MGPLISSGSDKLLFMIFISGISTNISDVNLSAFVLRLFHEDFALIVGTNTVSGISIMVHFKKKKFALKVLVITIDALRHFLTG